MSKSKRRATLQLFPFRVHHREAGVSAVSGWQMSAPPSEHWAAISMPSARSLSPRVRGSLLELEVTGMARGSIPAGAGEPMRPSFRFHAPRVYARLSGVIKNRCSIEGYRRTAPLAPHRCACSNLDASWALAYIITNPSGELRWCR